MSRYSHLAGKGFHGSAKKIIRTEILETQIVLGSR